METSKMIRLTQKVKLEKDEWEKGIWSSGNLVVGIDEAGRGCFAGPVVSAAVILPFNTKKRMLKDSKVMTPQQRIKAYDWIMRECYVGVGIVDHVTIDKINIYQASIESMRQALYNLIALPYAPSIAAILVDAVPLVLLHDSLALVPVHSIIKGETYSSSIAAASIVAKVVRDQLMNNYSKIFPMYKFDEHKGYGTSIHQEKIKIYGPSIIHRSTFIKKLLYEVAAGGQQELF